MKTGVSLIVILHALLFSQIASARAGWTDYVNVAELVPRARLYYEVKLPVKMNPSGCREANWFYQNYGSLGSNKMFDILLEGIKSGIRMRVYVTGVCNLNGYSEFSAVSVIP
jgi:site-specific recombinase